MNIFFFLLLLLLLFGCPDEKIRFQAIPKKKSAEYSFIIHRSYQPHTLPSSLNIQIYTTHTHPSSPPQKIFFSVKFFRKTKFSKKKRIFSFHLIIAFAACLCVCVFAIREKFSFSSESKKINCLLSFVAFFFCCFNFIFFSLSLVSFHWLTLIYRFKLSSSILVVFFVCE